MDLKIIVLVFVSALSVGHSAESDITEGPPTYDKPWVPAWGWSGSPTGWKNRHKKMVNQTREHKNDIKLVFYGDSKTEGWMGEGRKVWDKNYAKIGGYNYGISGDSTRQVLWRLEHKELDGLTPKVLVFMIGGNNFADNYNKGTDEEIVKAEHLIFTKIHEILPTTQILFVGQLPRGNASNKRAQDINTMWEKDMKTMHGYVHFVDCYTKFTNANGTQNTKVYIGDHIHLNNNGYEILAQILKPLIKRYL